MFDLVLLVIQEYLPIIVVIVVVGTILKYVRIWVAHLLGWRTSDPIEAGSRTTAGKVIGMGLAQLLAPIEYAPLVVSTLVFCSGLFLVADRMRLWDDGLVDARAVVVGHSTACVPYSTVNVPEESAGECTAAEAGQRSRLDVVELAYSLRDGRVMRARVARKFFEGPDTAIGATVPISYVAADPTHVADHLWAQSRISPWVLMAVGVALRGVAMVIGRIRRRLAGRPLGDEAHFADTPDRALMVARLKLGTGGRTTRAASTVIR